MILKNSLDIHVFQDELDFKTFENILESLNHVTPKKVSRSVYNAMQGNFLVETGEDKFGKRYDLFLPEDLVHGELLHLIDFLSRKLGIENYTPYSRIITKTKVMIGMILRGLGEDDGEIYLQELAEKYSLSPEFISRLQSQKDGGEKMSFSDAKEIIKKVKAKRNNHNSESIGKNDEDIAVGLEELKALYGEEFDLTFFRKGVNMLRLGMMTITRAEQEGRIRYCEENGFKKTIGKDGDIIYKKGDYVIAINIGTHILDINERLLREKIGIDKLKIELEDIKKSGDVTQVKESEYNAVNKVLEVLYEYYYQYTENDYGYQPSKIAEHKEIYCVGYSILGHAFLSELGIKHNGLHISRHSAIEVIIGNILFYFDPTVSKIAVPYKYGESQGVYKEVIPLVGKINKIIFAYSDETERLLLSKIYNNKGADIKNNKESGGIFNKVLQYNSKSQGGYRGKGLSLLQEGKYKLYFLYIYTANLMEGKSPFLEIFYKKEKSQIKQLIDSQNFEGLRLYLLELEKQDN